MDKDERKLIIIFLGVMAIIAVALVFIFGLPYPFR